MRALPAAGAERLMCLVNAPAAADVRPLSADDIAAWFATGHVDGFNIVPDVIDWPTIVWSQATMLPFASRPMSARCTYDGR